MNMYHSLDTKPSFYPQITLLIPLSVTLHCIRCSNKLRYPLLQEIFPHCPLPFVAFHDPYHLLEVLQNSGFLSRTVNRDSAALSACIAVSVWALNFCSDKITNSIFSPIVTTIMRQGNQLWLVYMFLSEDEAKKKRELTIMVEYDTVTIQEISFFLFLSCT